MHSPSHGHSHGLRPGLGRGHGHDAAADADAAAHRHVAAVATDAAAVAKRDRCVTCRGGISSTAKTSSNVLFRDLKTKRRTWHEEQAPKALLFLVARNQLPTEIQEEAQFHDQARTSYFSFMF